MNLNFASRKYLKQSNQPFMSVPRLIICRKENFGMGTAIWEKGRLKVKGSSHGTGSTMKPMRK